jgi:hypothetical protein
MSGVWKSMVKGSKAIGRAITGGQVFPKKLPQMPSVPTIDTATQGRQEADRIARRRGVLATIFAGSGGGGSASVGKSTLGGS